MIVINLFILTFFYIYIRFVSFTNSEQFVNLGNLKLKEWEYSVLSTLQV